MMREGGGCESSLRHSEQDAGFHLEKYESLVKKINKINAEIPQNKVTYLDNYVVFRPSQTVDCVRVVGRCGDKVVFLYNSRHGRIYFYDQLEALIAFFIDNKDSDYVFDSTHEVEHFLKYWRW